MNFGFDADPHAHHSHDVMDVTDPRDLALLSASALSAIGSVIVISTFARYRSLRRHPSQLIMSRSLLDLLFCAGLILSRFQYGSSSTARPFNNCTVFSFMSQFCSVTAEGYFLMLSVDLVVTITNPFSSHSKNTKRYHAIVLLMGLVTALLMVTLRHDGHHVYGRDNALHVCWSGSIKDVPVDPYTVALFTIPLLLIYAFAVCAVAFGRRRLRQGLPISYQARMGVFRNSFRYVLVYIIYWTMVGSVYIIMYIVREHPPKWLPVVLAVAVGSRGLVTLGVWLWTHNLSEAVRRAREGNDNGDDKELLPHLNQALRSEILTYVTSGILRGLAYASRKPGHTDTQSRGRKYNLIRIARSGTGLQTRAGSVSAISGGVSSLAKFSREISRAQANKSSTLLGGRLSPIRGSLNADATPYAPLLGSDNGQRDYEGVRPMQVRQGSGSWGMEDDNDGITRSRSRSASIVDVDSEFSFHDYEPHMFRRIREIYDISNDSYRNAFGSTAKERFSEGGSGAFMFMSSDQRFVVKTMSRSECHVLLDILPAYQKYVEVNPHTLICKFFGCHSIKMYRRIIYFAVMENILLTTATVHERYDLKGSWVNRHRRALGRGEKVRCRHCNDLYIVGDDDDKCSARPNGQHDANVILKDNDLNIKLRLDRTAASLLANQINSDIKFLRKQRIMDYSLLLGVHRAKYRLLDTSSTRRRPAALNLRSSTNFDGRNRGFSAASSVQSFEGERDEGSGRPPEHGNPRMVPPGLPSRSSTAPPSRGGQAEALRASATAPAARMSPRVRAALRRSQRRLTNGVPLEDANSVLEAVRARRRSFLRREVSSGGLTLDQVHAHTQGVGVAASIAAARTPRPHSESPAMFGVGLADEGGDIAFAGDGAADGAGATGDSTGRGSFGGNGSGSDDGAGAGAGATNADLGGLNAYAAPPGQSNGAGDPPGETYTGAVGSTVTSGSSDTALGLRPDGGRSPASMMGQVERPARPTSTTTLGPTSGNEPRLPPLGSGMRLSRSAGALHSLGHESKAGGIVTEGVATVVLEDHDRDESPYQPSLTLGAVSSQRNVPTQLFDAQSVDTPMLHGLPPTSSGRPSQSTDVSPRAMLQQKLRRRVSRTGAGAGAGAGTGPRGGAGHVESFFKQHRGGLQAVLVEGPGVYYMGIIDVLQRWDFWKRLEYFTKVYLLCSNRHGISAVHYDEYAERFYQRVAHEIIDNYEELVESADPSASVARSISTDVRISL